MRLKFLPFGLLAPLLIGQAWAQGIPFVSVDQGPDWTPATRSDFYSRDQGSRMIPLDWFRSLKQVNGQPFLADNLSRYGYLRNPDNANGLPVGFTASGPTGLQTVGMTCSACHTRQLDVQGKAYRIDGGPAIVDFQSFLSDLDIAVGNVLASDVTFATFAEAVLNSASPDPRDVASLRREVDAWYLRYHTLMTRALPTPSWGPNRLDAVGMIFNRVTGLDIGPPPSFLLPQNIKLADAPVRYPFLWNSPRQDETQWSAFADNGSDVLALARNLGQVLGVFCVFQPKKDGIVINFLNNNSANFDGLSRLEDLVRQIGPPKWPWEIQQQLAAQGKTIYERPTSQGGCVECHGIKPGKVRFPLKQTWATPIQDVGTDTRQHDILAWNAKTGVLQGAYIPFATHPLNENDRALNILATSVIGSIAEQVGSVAGESMAAESTPSATNQEFKPAQSGDRLPPALRDLEGAFHSISAVTPNAAGLVPPQGAYEARALQGIWAAAPYLHNGSVPTIAELLKPTSERVKKFKIGSAFDKANVGLAVEQTQFDYELETTDCFDRNSGNSRCGHEFGTQLTPSEKKALLEYLKTL